MTDFRKISFVHNALPDLNLGEVDTSLSLGDGTTTLKFPILVTVESADDAVRLSSSNSDVPFVVDGRDEIYLNGVVQKGSARVVGMEEAGDGIEAAKIIRVGGVPMIAKERLDDYKLYVQQLRIAMFLTESKDIKRLRKAPIYITS